MSDPYRAPEHEDRQLSLDDYLDQSDVKLIEMWNMTVDTEVRIGAQLQYQYGRPKEWHESMTALLQLQATRNGILIARAFQRLSARIESK